MKIKKINRKFKVGKKNNIMLTNVGSIILKNDELVTFKDGKKELDIAKKTWGYYGTPTLNKRLTNFGYMAALTRHKVFDTYAVLIVDIKKKKTFLNYLKKEDMQIICWLNIKNLKKIKDIFNK
tara:strand:+ start:653 stop:1021 length:369 start_codon:yes stop_codon:yes gene_type:complete